MKNKRIYLLLLVIVLSVISTYIFNIDNTKIYSIMLLLIALILWISNTLPMSITTLLLLCFLPILGIMNFNEVISNISINTSLFIMASQSITIALKNSNIPNYIVENILTKFKFKTKLLVFILGYVITLISGFMSSLATCTLFYGIISTSFDEKIKKTKLYKSLMLLIPISSGVGGFISPVGTPANILLLDILKNNNITISFIKWTSIGLPISIITITLVMISIILFIKPEKELKLSKTKNINLNLKDIKTIIIISLLIISWFISSFINLNTTIIAIFGLVIMLILNLFDSNTFFKETNWDLVITMGTVSAFMAGISKTEVLNDIVNILFNNLLISNTTILLIIISLLLFLLRSIVPTTTAVIALFYPILITISNKYNIDLTILLLILSYVAATSLLLIYTEPIYLITYKDKIYNEKDLLKIGIIPTIIMSVIISILIPILI